MLKTVPQNVQITEVGPRDGLQNEVLNLCTPDKITSSVSWLLRIPSNGSYVVRKRHGRSKFS